MKSHLAAAMLVAGAVLAHSAAFAASPALRGAVLFWAADRNGDSAVDRGEADMMRAVVFDVLDVNRDGRVTREEAGAVLVPVKEGASKKEADKAAKRREQLLVRLDLAKPEGIPRDEFVDRNGALFVSADKNKDGRLDRDEFVVFIGSFGALLPQ